MWALRGVWLLRDGVCVCVRSFKGKNVFLSWLKADYYGSLFLPQEEKKGNCDIISCNCEFISTIWQFHFSSFWIYNLLCEYIRGCEFKSGHTLRVWFSQKKMTHLVLDRLAFTLSFLTPNLKIKKRLLWHVFCCKPCRTVCWAKCTHCMCINMMVWSWELVKGL